MLGGSAEGVGAVRARMRSVYVAREHSPCEVQRVRQSRARMREAARVHEGSVVPGDRGGAGRCRLSREGCAGSGMCESCALQR